MALYITEYCKTERVENGFAIGTFRVPIEIYDEVMSLACTMLNSARVLKIKSTALAAEAKYNLPRQKA
jgi:hypothetical protein